MDLRKLSRIQDSHLSDAANSTDSDLKLLADFVNAQLKDKKIAGAVAKEDSADKNVKVNSLSGVLLATVDVKNDGDIEADYEQVISKDVKDAIEELVKDGTAVAYDNKGEVKAEFKQVHSKLGNFLKKSWSAIKKVAATEPVKDITEAAFQVMGPAGALAHELYKTGKGLLSKRGDSKISDADIDGYTTKKINNNHFEVLKNGEHAYDLEKKGSKWACSCTGFKYRGKCKHLDLLDEALPKRHPRKELDDLVPEIKEMFKGYDTWEIVGSYRRGKSDFKDIDILVETDPASFKKIEDILQQDPEYKRTMAGPDIIRGTYHGYDFDVTRVQPGEWGSFLLYRTGSAQFNIKMRGWLKSKGWKLNEHGLYDNEGNLLANKTEEDIFKAMGLPFIKPEDREPGKFEKFFKKQEKTADSDKFYNDISGEVVSYYDDTEDMGIYEPLFPTKHVVIRAEDGKLYEVIIPRKWFTGQDKLDIKSSRKVGEYSGVVYLDDVKLKDDFEGVLDEEELKMWLERNNNFWNTVDGEVSEEEMKRIDDYKERKNKARKSRLVFDKLIPGISQAWDSCDLGLSWHPSILLTKNGNNLDFSLEGIDGPLMRVDSAGKVVFESPSKSGCVNQLKEIVKSKFTENITDSLEDNYDDLIDDLKEKWAEKYPDTTLYVVKDGEDLKFGHDGVSGFVAIIDTNNGNVPNIGGITDVTKYLISLVKDLAAEISKRKDEIAEASEELPGEGAEEAGVTE